MGIASELMGRPKKVEKNTPVRITEAAIELARIASGYTGESVAEYVSRIISANALADIDRHHAELVKRTKPKGGSGP